MMWREIVDAEGQEHGEAGSRVSGGGRGEGVELEGLAKRFAEWESPVLGAATDHKIMSTSGWGKVSHGRSAAVTRVRHFFAWIAVITVNHYEHISSSSSSLLHLS